MAEKDAGRFVSSLRAAGWQPKPFLLSTAEKYGYTLLTDS